MWAETTVVRWATFVAHLRPILWRTSSCSVKLSDGPSSLGEQFCFSFCAININGFLKYEEDLWKNCTRTSFYRKGFLFSILTKRCTMQIFINKLFQSIKMTFMRRENQKNEKKRNPSLTSLFQSSKTKKNSISNFSASSCICWAVLYSHFAGYAVPGSVRIIEERS